MGDSMPTLQDLESEIIRLMPTALDIVADVVDQPGTSMESYDAILAVAEANPPLLFLAVVRCAAGFAHTADLAGKDVRALGRKPRPRKRATTPS